MCNKIKSIKAYPISYKLDKYFSSGTGIKKDMGTVLVEITTEDGQVGWGETHGPLTSLVKAIEDDFAQVVIGSDPFDEAVLWEKMQIKRWKGAPPGAIGAIDIALWDLKGKITGLPVYKLMGGLFEPRLMPYATCIFYNEEQPSSTYYLEKEAAHVLEQGFKAIKMKVGFGVKEDRKRVERLREIVGEDYSLMVDANQSYGYFEALKLGHALKDLGIEWFEEPLPWMSLEAYKELGERLNMPLAGGEVECNPIAFKEAICRRAVQIIQPCPFFAGGLTGCLQIRALAKANEVLFCPHAWNTIIGLSAVIQVTASFAFYPSYAPVKRPVLIEWDATPNRLREEIVASGPVVKDGWVNVSTEPGLGIELDRKAIRKYILK